MAVKVQGPAPPLGATVDIQIAMTAQANITAFVARQKVTQFVVTHVSSQLRAGPPDLHVGERLCWSVPVDLTSPARGELGKVGELLVDAATGEILAEAGAVERMREDAEHLARRAALQAGV